jgi:hypothetical protein
MNYKLKGKQFEIFKNDFYIFPTLRMFIDNHMYLDKNFSIEFHFLIFHARLLFMKE